MNLLTDNLIVGGTRIAYRDRGNGDPVIFIHGTPSHSYEWRNVVPAVEAAGFRVVTYDLLGYGLSERPAHHDTSVAPKLVSSKPFSTSWTLTRSASSPTTSVGRLASGSPSPTPNACGG
ncbi:alpha/beta fold hydrolase [Arthrobacter pigmenti]